MKAGKIMQEKLTVKQIRLRMNGALIGIGFFSAITLISSFMVYLTI